MYTTRIFMIVHVQCEKDNGEILGNAVMNPIWERVNNSCTGIFLDCTHENKIQFIILTHGILLSPPRAKTICNEVRPRCFVTGDLSFYTILFGMKKSPPNYFFYCMLVLSK